LIDRDDNNNNNNNIHLGTVFLWCNYYYYYYYYYTIHDTSRYTRSSNWTQGVGLEISNDGVVETDNLYEAEI
jgi:hypothetical protein